MATITTGAGLAARPRPTFNPLRRPLAALERQAPLGVVLMVPGLFLLAVFMGYPFFLGIYLAMTDSTIGQAGTFVGLKNFATLLSDGIFLQTVRNTFVYAFFTVPFKLAFGLALALVLNNK